MEKLAERAHDNAIKADRKQIKYEDLAEVRGNDPNLTFLQRMPPFSSIAATHVVLPDLLWFRLQTSCLTRYRSRQQRPRE